MVDIYLDKQLGFKNYQEASFWLLKLAAHENYDAMHILAKLYLRGKLGSKNISAAVELIEKIIAQAPSEQIKIEALNLLKASINPEANRELLNQLEFKVLKPHLEAVARKNSLAMVYVLEAYLDGMFLTWINHDDASQWAKEIEATFNSNNQFEPHTALVLARLYKQGDLLPQNIRAAIKLLFRASSNSSSLRAEKELEALLTSKNISSELKHEVIQSLHEIAENCLAEEPYRIGRILGDVYSEGCLIPPNFSKALFWYEKAASLNNSKAMYKLGKLFEHNNDLSQATQWFERYALWGKNRTLEPQEKQKLMYIIGKNYQQGLDGKPKSILQTAFFFRKASQMGHSEATVELAKLYEAGELGEQVKPVAVNLYKQLAKQNHGESIKILIGMYAKGYLTEPDPAKTEKWRARETAIISQNSEVNTETITETTGIHHTPKPV